LNRLKIFSTYYYNPKTCQYERVRLKWTDVSVYALGLIVTGAIFFIAILALQNTVVKTDREIALRKENRLLEKHRSLLSAQLTEVETSLVQLQTKEQELSQKLFDTGAEEKDKSQSTLQKSDVLFADASTFQQIVEQLKARSSVLAGRSASTNAYFGNNIKISAKERELLQSIPSKMPVADSYQDQLASGFGSRINPFHKGLHDHPGIDFVAPRGSSVFATGTGRVVRVNRSTLEAGYGNFIDMDHGHGFVTRYAHLEDTYVRVGQKVEKGFAIGTVGNSGGSVAPHVHYEIIRDGENVDPIHFMIEGLSSADHRKLTAVAQKRNQSLD
jgi:murein DD-endopeptidase MepM/ murein hydrolase activator NlpD